jgi:exopolyphosphatase/guanosine-5'-triphosphate,3'-diphosphate pyrophosphatase
LGTNNCRLLVARPQAEGFRVVDAFSRIVRLGEGVAETGRLSDAAMARTVAALKVCAAKLRRGRVSRSRAIATEACRRAENCDAFLDRVQRETGFELEIISSAEEAHLALAGCVPLLENETPRALLFDIGGGSTELIWVGHEAGAPPSVEAWTSLASGVVNMAERFGGDRVDGATFNAMVAEVAALVAPFAESQQLGRAAGNGGVQLLGTSGTVTTIAGVHLDLPQYDRAKVDGVRLTFPDVRQVVNGLVSQSYEQRAAHPCIGPGRGDVVIAGCAILEAIMRACPVGQLRVADRGLREGLLLGMMRTDGAVQ